MKSKTKNNINNQVSYEVIMNTIGLLGSIGGILSIFILLNGFLFTVKASISDYFLANSLLLIIGYLTYLTKEVNKLKEVINERINRKRNKNKKAISRNFKRKIAS